MELFLEAADDSSGVLVSSPLVGDTGEVPSSWAQPGPFLHIVSIWWGRPVERSVLSLSHFAFQMLINQPF